MRELEPIILLGGCLICAALGALGAAVWYRAKLERIHSDTWRAAKRFYARANAPQRESRL